MGPRVPYVPNHELYRQYYSGGGFPNVFTGDAWQKGYGLGGLFSGLIRRAMPILKDTALSAGKNLLRSGADLFEDVISGKKDWKTALKDRGIEGLKRVGGDVKNRVLRGGRKNKRKIPTTTKQINQGRGGRKRQRDIFDDKNEGLTRKRGKQDCFK